MSNSIRDIVAEIQFIHKKENWTIEDVAKSIGRKRITLYRAMKNPDEDASKAIRALLIEKHGDVIQNVSRGTHTEELIISLKQRIEEHKQSMDEQKRILEKHNDFLQEMVKTNLETILKNQEIGGGIVQEILERDVLREAKGNPKKAEDILEAIRLKIAKTSGIALIKYIPDGESIAHK